MENEIEVPHLNSWQRKRQNSDYDMLRACPCITILVRISEPGRIEISDLSALLAEEERSCTMTDHAFC